jgi:hypothetical protein
LPFLREIQGDLTAQNIFLNDTPLANDSGEYNFSGVKWEFRKGTQDQTYIAGMPQVDNELAVGTTVTTTAPWTRQFTNLSWMPSASSSAFRSSISIKITAIWWARSPSMRSIYQRTAAPGKRL